MRTLTCIAFAVAATCAWPISAGAVVGGEPLQQADVPWFTPVAGCGGTLVTPDRVLTAAHCVGGRSAGEIGSTVIGGEPRTVTHVAMHPNFGHRNGENYLDDVAIVQLNAPVTSVTPVTLAGAGSTTEPARIIGVGNIYAPGTGRSEAEMLKGGLHQAVLRQVSDADCATVYKTNRPGTGERFNAARMRCAVDVDGRQPLSSGCFGDSGGPLIAGTDAAPIQLGVTSWGGDRCGADHSPSVFADVSRYRDFILDATPTWAPTQRYSAHIHGSARLGKTLECSTNGRERGTHHRYEWKRRSGLAKLTTVGTARTHRVSKSDGGRRLFCFVTAYNDGGEILVGVDGVRVAG